MAPGHSIHEANMPWSGIAACDRAYLLFIASFLALGSCTVQYVSRYDAITEQSITEIQRSVEHILQAVERDLGKPEANFDNYAEAYEQIHVDAALLNVRARAIDLNSITAKQSRLLLEWLANLEDLHKAGFSDADMVAVVRNQGEQIFVAMLKFELAKKRQFDTAIIDGG